MERLDNRTINIKKNEILAFSCVRNEAKRIPYFLEHHRNLGVDHFFFVDNASIDQTTDILLSQPDTYIYQTNESYADSNCGMDWLNNLLSEFGVGHWTLTVDADELFIYPYHDQVKLPAFCQYLKSIRANAVKSFLLDMYSNKPIRETIYKSGEPFIETCPYFDKNTYEFEKKFFIKKRRAVPIRGGVRHRLFWEGFNRDKPSPLLIKYPLIKWKENFQFKLSTHMIDNITEADITGVLQHFKLFNDFYQYTKTESKRNEHADNAAEYKSYWDVMNANDTINPYFEGSLKYKNSQQLIDLGLMHVSKKYQKFVSSNSKIFSITSHN